jgi:hypothetical protein
MISIKRAKVTELYEKHIGKVRKIEITLSLNESFRCGQHFLLISVSYIVQKKFGIEIELRV